MSRRKDFYFRFKGEAWRGGVAELSLEAEGLYIHLVSRMNESPDCGYPNDAGKIAKGRNLRDKRTVAKPLAELIAARKFAVWKGRLYNPTVCRDRHALAVYRKERSPVPAEVWPLLEEIERSTDPVDDPEDDPGIDARDREQSPESSPTDGDQIENSGGKILRFQRPAGRESESQIKSKVVAVTDQTAARARGDPPGGA